MSACKAATVSKRAVRAVLRGCDGARVCAHLHPRRTREGLAHAHAAGVIVLKMDRAHRGARVTSSRSCRWRMRDARLTQVFMTVGPGAPSPSVLYSVPGVLHFFATVRRDGAVVHTTPLASPPGARPTLSWADARAGPRADAPRPRRRGARAAHPKEPTIG